MARRVVIVLFDGFQMFDMTGPADVFAFVPEAYTVEVTAVAAGAVRAQNGIGVAVETPIAEIEGPIDTLIVVGGVTTPAAVGDRGLIDGIRRLAGLARRTTSVCSGAFFLAEAGLLDGRRVTTHWVAADHLRRLYPDVRVDDDSIYVRDGDVWTSAGVSSGVDLALAMVADDLGYEVARTCACWLVVYLHRPGGQSQFSMAMSTAVPRDEGLRDLQAYIDGNPAGDLSVPALARRAGMSERHFSRVFTEQTGLSPGRYVERS
ncbi:MAG: AraC family transcriptional regulator, partial [Nonomuraea sp.]|nr:AraC family transcriptional regulator [Nonomuraea sp.]